jgi:hypothetical protein
LGIAGVTVTQAVPASFGRDPGWQVSQVFGEPLVTTLQLVIPPSTQLALFSSLTYPAKQRSQVASSAYRAHPVAVIATHSLFFNHLVPSQEAH